MLLVCFSTAKMPTQTTNTQGVQPTVWAIVVKNTEHKYKTKMFSIKNSPLEEDFLIIRRTLFTKSITTSFKPPQFSQLHFCCIDYKSN